MVVVEGELHFGEAIQELARDLVEEDGGVAVELGSDSNGRPSRETAEYGIGSGTATSSTRWRRWWRINRVVRVWKGGCC